MKYQPLEIPPFFEENKTSSIWQVPYQKLAPKIRELYVKKETAPKTALLLIDEIGRAHV